MPIVLEIVNHYYENVQLSLINHTIQVPLKYVVLFNVLSCIMYLAQVPLQRKSKYVSPSIPI